MRIALISPGSPAKGRLYGAERLFAGLHQALANICETDWIEVPVSEATWDSVLESYLDCYDLDVAKYDAVISTKNPTFMVRHPNHICWLVHQIRVFYDRFDDEYGHCDPASLAEQSKRKELIHQLDNVAFRGVRKIFTIGHEVGRRLKHYNGFDAEVLHPPLANKGHFCGRQEYLLLPGRLHRWKRVDLAIRAFKLTRAPIPLLIAGTGEDELYFKQLAGEDSRIKFLGYVSDDELIELYAHALAVLFVPKDEDFGYVALEAMMSHKPLITCTDSGEPVRLVKHEESGFVVPPDPAKIADAIHLLIQDHDLASRLGKEAFHRVPEHSWDDVARQLLDAVTDRSKVSLSSLGRSSGHAKITRSFPPIEQAPSNPLRVLVADMQPLLPTIGGGRVRLRKVCEGLARQFETSYIGAFDWAGPASTDDFLLPTLRSRVFSLAPLHYRIAAILQKFAPGGSVIDVCFSLLGRLSRQFISALRQELRTADVVVFSHPWVFPLVEKELGNKLVLYDSHNFEAGLRAQLLSTTRIGQLVAFYGRWVEKRTVKRSHAIFACSSEDALAMSRAYDVPEDRIFLVPNCADTNIVTPATAGERESAKAKLGLAEQRIAVFVASGYRPNTEAAAFIAEELARELPDVQFIIAGNVKDDYLRTRSATDLAKKFAPAELPCCLATGWYDPEQRGLSFVRWTMPNFSFATFASPGTLTISLQSPQRNHLLVKEDGRTLLSANVQKGRNTFTVEVPTAGECEFLLKKDFFATGDPRRLGCTVEFAGWRNPVGESSPIDLRRDTHESLLPSNVHFLGVVSDELLHTLLKAADVALNPVEFGSGTNVKLLQYMAAGLPIVTTAVGARGIEQIEAFCLAERKGFAARISAILSNKVLREQLGSSARQTAVQHYDWRFAGETTVNVVRQKLKYLRRMNPPFFSVVIPTFNRPDHLSRLLEALVRQTFPDFEVIIVDQSSSAVTLPIGLEQKLRVKLVYSKERGPALARNKGWREAQGVVLAFTDDDCLPHPDWLERAAQCFDREFLAGLEGRIRTTKFGDPRYRTTTNDGFHGIGFMTANLFLRRDLVERVGGFDERFTQAFREDTDLAWRVLDFGDIPYSADVVVYHPPHPVNVRRESPADRARMFAFDPLLFSKHPKAYLQLMRREQHYRKTAGFWTHFVAGLDRDLDMPIGELLETLRTHDAEWWKQMVAEGNETNDQRDKDAFRSLVAATLSGQISARLNQN